MSTSARRLRIPHPDLSLSQKTYLNTDISSGNTLQVFNNEAFTQGKIAVLGEPGHEKSESRPVQSTVTKTAIILSANVSFSHNSGDVVYRSEYDQIEISSDSGSGWSILATIDIQWDQLYSIYVDQGGTDATSYRFRFVNSFTSDTSEYSPTLTGSGYGKQSVGRMIKNVRDVIKDPEKKIVSDTEIIRFLTDAKDEVRAHRNDWWFWKRESNGQIATIANTFIYNLDDISERIDYISDVRYRFYDGTEDYTYPIDIIPDILFDDRTRDNTRQPDDHIIVGNIVAPDDNSVSGYLRVYPTPKTTGIGSFFIRWYENEPDFQSITDTTAIPLAKILEDYAIAKCERIKGNDKKADVYEELFYGPSDLAKDKQKLTGIPLLEKMQSDRLRAIQKPRSLKIFVGRKAMQRLYHGRYASVDWRREHYFDGRGP